MYDFFGGVLVTGDDHAKPFATVKLKLILNVIFVI